MNTETTETTFTIPAENLPRFERELKKLSRRARKLAVAAFLGYEIVRTVVKDSKYVDVFGITRVTKTVSHEVRAWGPSVKLDGWAFVGRLDFKAVPGGVMRMMVPGETCPTEFHDVESTRCDHCGHRRRRNDTFILRHDDGRQMVVGRTCLGDFLGHATPEELARVAELPMIIRMAGEESEGWGGMDGRPVDLWNPTEVLAVAHYAIRTYGWASSREQNSTRETVLSLLVPTTDRKAEEARRAELEAVTDADWDFAGQAIEWIADVDTTHSDYLHNLKTTLTVGVTWKSMGIAVSGATAYSRHMEKEVERRNRARQSANSGHVGAVGERLDFDAEVLFTRYTESYYGTTTIVKMRDDSGNVFTWFASGGKEIATGDRFHVRGTVKKHDEYRGEKQTVITRCKLRKVA